MEGWFIEVLKANGLAGAFIFVLASANVAQWRAGRAKDKENKDLHAQRAAERETLVQLLERANTAQNTTAEVTAKRNEIMNDLSGAIMAQANSNDRLSDRVSGQAEMFKEKLGDFKHVVDSFGESNRVVTGILRDISGGLSTLVGKVDGVDRKLGTRGRA